jgi:hypothetical protein
VTPARPPDAANPSSPRRHPKPIGAATGCAEEAARLLPWYVAGTLDGPAARRVAAHLAQCDTCRADARQLACWRGLMRAPSQVEYAPQAGFRKLVARIDAQAREASAAPDARPRLRGLRARWAGGSGGPLRWLAALAAVQGVALALAIGALVVGWLGLEIAPRFQTLGAATPAGMHLRVVFAPTVTLDELHELLRANRLVALAGPSEAGLFTLAPQTAAGGRDAARAVLQRLRADPRVRFAELLDGEAAAAR